MKPGRDFQQLSPDAPSIWSADTRRFSISSMSARHRTIDRIQHAHRADSGIWQIDKEHARAVVRLRHDNADSGALGSGDEFLSPVDDLVIAIQSARGLHHRRIGPEVATPHSTTIERTSAN
jgi:hypothetical protein